MLDDVEARQAVGPAFNMSLCINKCQREPHAVAEEWEPDWSQPRPRCWLCSLPCVPPFTSLFLVRNKGLLESLGILGGAMSPSLSCVRIIPCHCPPPFADPPMTAPLPPRSCCRHLAHLLPVLCIGIPPWYLGMGGRDNSWGVL